MQQMVTPFANVATQYGSILPATRRDTSVSGCYCVVLRLLRTTKPHDSRLVSPQKLPVSRPWLKCQQALIGLGDQRIGDPPPLSSDRVGFLASPLLKIVLKAIRLIIAE